ncbi:8707_t:CDS:1 [Paraglomus occultum]|uniref:8707_t:CDS:1 n=1 Tax=Paraglomus occultum TaxID=144539 RepID=A0A9N9A084_9GLOM|nr:8707_t:CDS:1 [Paraglomus occultum]
MSKLSVQVKQMFILPYYFDNDRAYTIELMNAANIHNPFERHLLLNPPYALSLPLKELLEPARKTSALPPPRPMNPWIIFRKDLEGQLRFFNSERPRSMKETSATASFLWKNQPRVKLYFTVLAKLAEKIHKDVYPDYCYRPSKSKRPKSPNWRFIRMDERNQRKKSRKNVPTTHQADNYNINNSQQYQHIEENKTGQPNQHIGDNDANNISLHSNIDVSHQYYNNVSNLISPYNVYDKSFNYNILPSHATIQNNKIDTAAVGTLNFPIIDQQGYRIASNVVDTAAAKSLVYIPLLGNAASTIVMEECPIRSNGFIV